LHTNAQILHHACTTEGWGFPCHYATFTTPLYIQVGTIKSEEKLHIMARQKYIVTFSLDDLPVGKHKCLDRR
jgi:hypothetical protein